MEPFQHSPDTALQVSENLKIHTNYAGGMRCFSSSDVTEGSQLGSTGTRCCPAQSVGELAPIL
ncbi:hypothetical protein PHLCEN_2v8449 [Hermanssonia centrifuga]|uniref:Uncharacterized protein n=1 Tax=Hermanssonia centrifuga TaxID=98765 RepID=A0A2R6NTN2_9APHY|nr:hypothetical protein PHLCEN_2v8449 [Hermanssonia centrifuga]